MVIFHRFTFVFYYSCHNHPSPSPVLYSVLYSKPLEASLHPQKETVLHESIWSSQTDASDWLDFRYYHALHSIVCHLSCCVLPVMGREWRVKFPNPWVLFVADILISSRWRELMCPEMRLRFVWGHMKDYISLLVNVYAVLVVIIFIKNIVLISVLVSILILAVILRFAQVMISAVLSPSLLTILYRINMQI